MRVRLRPARPEDSRVLFDWANDSATRRSSFLPDPIEWENHIAWFEARLDACDESQIFMAEQGDGELLGQIRFDRSGGDAEIDYTVSPTHRGNRIGVRLLELGRRRIVAVWPGLTQVVGVVRPENVASIKSFERSGFREDGSSAEAARFVWRPADRHFVLAASRPWYEDMGERLTERVAGSFDLIRAPDELSPAFLESVRPSYVFLPHWSWIIEEEVHSNFDCVVFHMTDLPFGRGGSPLQNLISMGIKDTMISAIFVGPGLDSGDILLKRALSLHGCAEEIFIRASELIEEMIMEIIEKDPVGAPQKGEPVTFRRRTPEESTIDDVETLGQLFDHIRMLDAEGYPHAFLDAGPFRLEFTRASRRHGKLVADCTITAREER